MKDDHEFMGVGKTIMPFALVVSHLGHVSASLLAEIERAEKAGNVIFVLSTEPTKTPELPNIEQIALELSRVVKRPQLSFPTMENRRQGKPFPLHEVRKRLTK